MNVFQSLLHNEIQYMSSTSHVQEQASQHTTILYLQLLLQKIKSHIIGFCIINRDSYHHFDTLVIQAPFNSFPNCLPFMIWNYTKIQDLFLIGPITINVVASETHVVEVLNGSPCVGSQRHPLAQFQIAYEFLPLPKPKFNTIHYHRERRRHK